MARRWEGCRPLPTLNHSGLKAGDYIAKLNRLEKINAIPSAEEWKDLRLLRNAFAHDYPEDSAIQAATLNKAAAGSGRLLAILTHTEQFACHLIPKGPNA